MKKSDLKTGMLIEHVDGTIGKILINTIIDDKSFTEKGKHMDLHLIDDLNNQGIIGNKIIRVYEPIENRNMLSFNLEYMKKIWELDKKYLIIQLFGDDLQYIVKLPYKLIDSVVKGDIVEIDMCKGNELAVVVDVLDEVKYNYHNLYREVIRKVDIK